MRHTKRASTWSRIDVVDHDCSARHAVVHAWVIVPMAAAQWSAPGPFKGDAGEGRASRPRLVDRVGAGRPRRWDRR